METEGFESVDESKWIAEKFKILEIPKLFYSAEFGRIRKLLRNLTLSDEMDMQKLGFKKFIARLEIWNQIGIPLLFKFNRPIEAEDLYKEMLDTLIDLEKRTGKHYHKGTPNHNLAVSLLNQDKKKEAKKYFLQALKDDILLCQQDNKLRIEGFPAYKVFLKTYGKTPPNNIEEIDKLLGEL